MKKSSASSESDFIASVVVSFYQKATTDIIIGFHFRHIQDFNQHIPRIISFWEIQLLGQSRAPLTAPFELIQVHRPLKINPGQINRWIKIFEETLDEHQVEENLFNLKTKWLEKLKVFQQQFLTSKLLFGP